MCVLSECLKPSTSMKNGICSSALALLSTTWLILVGRERSRTASECCMMSDEMLIGSPSGRFEAEAVTAAVERPARVPDRREP